MKRRDFLKLIGITLIAPSALVMKENLPFKPNAAQKMIANTLPIGLVRAWSLDSLYAGQMVEWVNIDNMKLVVRPIKFDEIYVE